MIRATREHLANILPEHGEEDLAKRVLTITDAQLERVGELGGYYAWSEEAFELGLGMGGTRALCLATIDVLEGSMRELRQTRTSGELQWGLTPELSDVELAQEHSLRLGAITAGRSLSSSVRRFAFEFIERRRPPLAC